MIIGLFKKFNLRFFYLNLIAVVVFGLLYYAQDVFITSHQELAKRLNILDETPDKVNYSNEVSPLPYYFWFSLITQTTVGYSGADNSKTGKSVSYLNSPNRLSKFVNFLQLLSILFIISIA